MDHPSNSTNEEIAALASQSLNHAQRILTRALRLEVVPLRFAYDLQGNSNYFLKFADGWVQEVLQDEEGHERTLHRVAACPGVPLHVTQWAEQAGWLRALADIAKKRKGYEVHTPAGQKPVEILTASFMNNGHLVVLHRLAYKQQTRWGLVVAPPGEYGGGGDVLKAGWAVGYPMPQPQNRAAAIANANRAAPPVRVVEIKNAVRGTPRGFYMDKYNS